MKFFILIITMIGGYKIKEKIQNDMGLNFKSKNKID